MYMTDEEICRHYRLAKTPSEEARILADLNAVGLCAMQKKLRELGLAVPEKTQGRPHCKIDAGRAMQLYADGATDVQMADQLGVRVEAVQRWREKRGLFRYRGAQIKRERKQETEDPDMVRKKSEDTATAPEAVIASGAQTADNMDELPPEARIVMMPAPVFSAGQLATIFADAEKLKLESDCVVELYGEKRIIRGVRLDVRYAVDEIDPSLVQVVLEV